MFDVDQRVILKIDGYLMGGRIMARQGGTIGPPPELGLPDIGWSVPPHPKPQRDRAGYYMVTLNKDPAEPPKAKPRVVFAHKNELTAVSDEEPQG